MIQDDINQFEEMVADCYSVSIGTKRTIEITKHHNYHEKQLLTSPGPLGGNEFS